MTSTYSPAYQRMLALLRQARQTAGFTQAQLAQLLGKHQSHVSKSEKGERRLDAVEFLYVCRLLGVDPYPLLREVECHLPPEVPLATPVRGESAS